MADLYDVPAMSPLWKFVEPRLADHIALRVRVRREQLRNAVRFFLANRVEMLRRNGLPPDAEPRDVMVKIWQSRGRGAAGHWTFSYDRHLGLRQAYCGLRYARLLDAARARRAA